MNTSLSLNLSILSIFKIMQPNQGLFLAGRTKAFGQNEILEILNNFDPTQTKHVNKIVNPLGGEVYLF